MACVSLGCKVDIDTRIDLQMMIIDNPLADMAAQKKGQNWSKLQISNSY
jgi:hypothetical protein